MNSRRDAYRKLLQRVALLFFVRNRLPRRDFAIERKGPSGPYVPFLADRILSVVTRKTCETVGGDQEGNHGACRAVMYALHRCVNGGGNKALLLGLFLRLEGGRITVSLLGARVDRLIAPAIAINVLHTWTCDRIQSSVLRWECELSTPNKNAISIPRWAATSVRFARDIQFISSFANIARDKSAIISRKQRRFVATCRYTSVKRPFVSHATGPARPREGDDNFLAPAAGCVVLCDRKSRMMTSQANPLRSPARSDKRATVREHTSVHSDRSHKGLHGPSDW